MHPRIVPKDPLAIVLLVQEKLVLQDLPGTALNVDARHGLNRR
jgi:hypothetical protein